MTLPALATLDDLAARVGGIEEADEPRAQAALDDASAKVRAVAGKTWTTDGNLDDDVPDIVVTVTLSAARRSFVNADGVRTEQVGSFSYGLAHASPDVYLTAAEERMVRSAAGRSGVSVQPTTRSTSDRADTSRFLGTVYGDDGPAGEPIPWADPGLEAS